MSIPSTDHSTGKSQQLDVEAESVKQALHRLDQYQPTEIMELPPCPPIEEIFQPSMAMEQETKIQPSTANRKPQICIARIFIFDLVHAQFTPLPSCLSNRSTSHFVAFFCSQTFVTSSISLAVICNTVSVSDPLNCFLLKIAQTALSGQ